MPVVFVQNMIPEIVILSKDVKSEVMLTFAGKDDPSGDDVQPVDDEFLRHPSFLRCLDKGILAIEDEFALDELDERTRMLIENPSPRRLAAAEAWRKKHSRMSGEIAFDATGTPLPEYVDGEDWIDGKGKRQTEQVEVVWGEREYGPGHSPRGGRPRGIPARA